ncbi:structural constituent of ribosome [Spatholobus suberectus]|nr:structural constituent of ribosome [Spatholobus suberectus]
MGARNLVMLKTHVDSINLSSANGFVYENVLWALASLWVFFCNYVLYSLGLILRYIFRFRVEDRKSEHLAPHVLVDQPKRNQIEDSKIDGFAEELANLLFPIFENFQVAIEEREGETECPVLLEKDSDTNIHQDANKLEGETECSVLKETGSDIHQDAKKLEGETEHSVLKEKDSDTHEDGKKREGERERSVSMETVSYVHEDVKKIDENETESSVSMEGDSNFPPDKNRKKVEEEKTEEPFFTDANSAEASDLVEEPRIMTFTFRQNYPAANVSDNLFSSTKIIAKMEFSEHNLEEGPVDQEKEKEHSVQEQRNITSNTTSGQIFHSNAFGGSDSSDVDDVPQDNNTLPSNFGSGSCSNNIDDSVTHQTLSPINPSEEFDSENLKGIKDERVEDSEETEYSCDSEVSHSFNFHLDEGKDEKEGPSYLGKETMWEDNSDESDFDEEEDEDEDADDFEWEHDEVVEQLRLELKNARQGGLATILEEEEEEEIESPKVVEDLKPLKIKEKIEFKDHIIEIQKVYRCYAEKIRKLDVLNYQTMHAIGLLQLKEPLQLMLMPKSTVQSVKPLISQNLWPRKALKQISDPILKFVQELHRDLELVYVGQVCLSWEILCWQHTKVEELKQYDSQWPRSYNLVAGEFQLFQVLMQRFLEDEPFQGPRIQNYVKNRCVIRNLLQVPAIKDDNTKDKKIIKLGEEYAIDGERLAHIIKKSMRVFWEFVRADKDYGNVIKVSHQTGIDDKDPAISDLLRNVRTQLQKKERKLKDTVRSGNCIVRKFQKHNDDQIQLDQEQLLAQVGLRLVSRVVHMKNLRKDQLMWCNEKLNRIKFVGRKVQVEPSFLFLPC